MSAAPAALPDWARRLWVYRFRYVLVYLALAASPLVVLRRAYQPRVGFSSLIWFGEPFAAQRLQRLDDVPVYTMSQSEGYDGQFYAQMAVAPKPLDRSLETALDAPGYRERRALLPVVAHILGLGQPGGADDVRARSTSSAGCCWRRCWRAGGFRRPGFTTWCAGRATCSARALLVSVTRSLTDVPALLVIALAMRCLELNRGRAAVALLAVAGLVRETSVLAARCWSLGRGRRGAGRARSGRSRSAWRRARVDRLCCCATRTCRAAQNFAPPLFGVAGKLSEVAAAWRSGGFAVVRGEFLAVVALAIQVGFLLRAAAARRPVVAAGRAVRAVCVLCWAVPSGGACVGGDARRLPLTLAFNVLAPRSGRAGRCWWPQSDGAVRDERPAPVPRLEQTRCSRRGVITSATPPAGTPRRIDGQQLSLGVGRGARCHSLSQSGRGAGGRDDGFRLRRSAIGRWSIHAPGTTDRVRVQAAARCAPPARRTVSRSHPATPSDVRQRGAAVDRARAPTSARLTFSVHDLSVR